MNTVSNILRRLRIFDEPGFYIAIVIVFFLGLGMAPSLGDRNLSLLIGLFVAITAFLGVIYSKEKEWLLKNHEIELQKIEEFAINIFEWIEELDSLVVTTKHLKIENGYNPINQLSEDYVSGRVLMTKILTRKGKLLALISLYGSVIGNKDILDEIMKYQSAAIRNIYPMLSASTEDEANKSERYYHGEVNKMRREAKKLMTHIKPRSI